MKPISLTIAGLHSFRETQEIRFDTLSEAGVFGIFGPTGSGKSTILDALTLALYGTVGRAEHNTRGILNHAEKTLCVSLEFQVGQGEHKRVYRVERAYKRKDDIAVQNTRSRFMECLADNPVVLADKDSDVTQAVKQVLGLEPEDFTRAVVLPQGKFAEFLNLRGAERNKMLERLFSLEQFGDVLSQRVKQRLDAADREHEKLVAVQQSLGDASEEAIQGAETALLSIRSEEVAHRRRLEEARNKYEQGKLVREQQETLQAVDESLAVHRAQSEQIRSVQRQIDRAVRAARIMPAIQADLQARHRLEQAIEHVQKLEAEVSTLRGQVSLAEEAVKECTANRVTRQPQLNEQLFKLQDGLSLATSLETARVNEARLQEDVRKTTADYQTAEAARQQADVQLAEVKQQLTSLHAELRDHAVSADQRAKFSALQLQADSFLQAQKSFQEARAEADKRSRAAEAEKKQLEDQSQAVKLLEQELRAAQATATELRTPDVVKEQLATDRLKLAQVHQIAGQRRQEDTQRDGLEEELAVVVRDIATGSVELDALEDEIASLEGQIHSYREHWKLAEQEHRQRLAAQFAATLQDEQPCPVCGSTHHPLPAVWTEGSDETEGESLSANLDGLQARLMDCATARTDLKSKLAGLEATRNGLTIRLEDIERKMVEYTRQLTAMDSELTDIPAAGLERWLSSFEANLANREDRVHRQAQELEEAETRIGMLQQAVAKQSEEHAASRAKWETAVRECSDAALALEVAAREYQKALEGFRDVLADCGGPAAEADTQGVTWTQGVAQKVKRKDEKSELLQNQVSHLQTMLNELSESQMERVRRTVELAKVLHEHESGLQQAKSSRLDVEKKLHDLTGGLPLQEALQQTQTELDGLLRAEDEATKAYEALGKALSETAQQLSGANGKAESAEFELQARAAELQKELAEAQFATVGEATDALLDDTELAIAQTRVSAFQETETRLTAKRNEILAQLGETRMADAEWHAVETGFHEAEGVWKASLEAVGAADRALRELRERHMQWIGLESERQERANDVQKLTTLRQLFSGNRFVEYMAQEQLEFVASLASDRLKQLTRNRYALEVASDGRFLMRDDHNGGVKRPVSTLSGGETFLTSLALALSLSTQIQLRGRFPLEFFFLDEGFGTLDPELLDVVMSALEKLHLEHMTIGVISHVPELRQRMQRRLVVEPAEAAGRGTRVRVEIA